jgi:iron complex outermembrane receptor protein
VTAQRRTENIKEVPVSVSAIKGEKLDVIVSGGEDIRVLAGKVPSLNVESSNGRTFPRFYIRGYGNTDFSLFASQPVSLIYDDIVQENPILKGFPIFDVAGVEVLRGPQGTLFGRNTPAGVVKFESEKPNLKKVEGYYNASWGTHNTVNVDGAVNVPLSDKWAMRVSTLRQHRDDFVNNYSDLAKTNKTGDLDGYNEHAERVQFLYTPDSTFSALFNVHQRTTTGSARLFRANLIKKGTNDIADGYDLDSIVTNAQNFQDLKTNGANAAPELGPGRGQAVLDHRLRRRGPLQQPRRHRRRHHRRPGLHAVPGADRQPPDRPEQYSQEFRVESKNAGPLNWQAGLYYFDEDATGGSDNFDSVTQAQTSRVASDQKNKAWAAFGSVTYAVNDAFTLRGGLRYTDDKKDFAPSKHTNVTQIGPAGISESKSKVNWDLSGTYKLNRDVNLYARMATGFRAPSIAAASASVPVTVADAETVTSVEGGIKADLFERRARALLAVRLRREEPAADRGRRQLQRHQADQRCQDQGPGAEFDFEGIVSPVAARDRRRQLQLHRDPRPEPVGGQVRPVHRHRSDQRGRPRRHQRQPAAAGAEVDPQRHRALQGAAGGRRRILRLHRLVLPYEDQLLPVRSRAEFSGKPLTEGGLRVGYNWAGGKYEVAAFGRNILDQRRITGAIDFNNLTGFTNEPRVKPWVTGMTYPSGCTRVVQEGRTRGDSDHQFLL